MPFQSKPLSRSLSIVLSQPKWPARSLWNRLIVVSFSESICKSLSSSIYCCILGFIKLWPADRFAPFSKDSSKHNRCGCFNDSSEQRKYRPRLMSSNISVSRIVFLLISIGPCFIDPGASPKSKQNLEKASATMFDLPTI